MAATRHKAFTGGERFPLTWAFVEFIRICDASSQSRA